MYTLLAWDGADGLTNRKWVETVDLRNGRVRFGSPRFELAEGLRKRHVMAYADAVQAVLRIEREPLRIIMDDLAPQDPAFQGQHCLLRSHAQLQRADLEKRPLALPEEH